MGLTATDIRRSRAQWTATHGLVKLLLLKELTRNNLRQANDFGVLAADTSLIVLDANNFGAGMPSEATQILTAICAGDRSGVARLFEVSYDDFRALARKYLGSGASDNALQATDLVHEAFVKLVDHQKVDWRGKSHFYAIGAQAMRHILVDYAKRRARKKRGGGRRRVPLDEGFVVAIRNDEDVLAIDEALDKLASINETRAKIVELRFFAGMTVEETAEALGVSGRTVQGHWTFAKAWLRRELTGGDEEHDSGT